MPKRYPNSQRQVADSKLKILEAIRSDGCVYKAVGLAGVSLSAFYAWRKRDAKFRSKLKTAMEVYQMAILKRIADNDRFGEPTKLAVYEAGITYATYLKWNAKYKQHGTETDSPD